MSGTLPQCEAAFAPKPDVDDGPRMVRGRVMKNDVMTKENKAKTSGAQPARMKMPIRNPARNDRRDTWRPQPCGFSREEMRQIVLEMIG